MREVFDEVGDVVGVLAHRARKNSRVQEVVVDISLGNVEKEMRVGYEIRQGDWTEVLRTMPDESVHCVVTSPPYWGLRDYGVSGQLGLERTPEEYVAKMVEGFREVRRVLRKDGTLWLNLGDSYAGSWGNYGGQNRGNGSQRDITNGSQAPNPAYDGLEQWRPPASKKLNGIKPKDLCGIPWAVAFALRSPYYTGKIRNEMDRIWLAAMIDGEGCMFIHKRKIGQNAGDGYSRKSDTYGAGLEIANTSERIIRRCMEITGVGSICRQDKDRRQPLYRWNLRSNECRKVIREIYPYLVGKQQQARLVLACPPSGVDAAKAHAGVIALHNGMDCDIDFPAPKPMFEPGFYLRQDCIWSKSNPMPESVRDRCTKAHEYIFLLSKSERYLCDMDAIAELSVTAWEIDQTKRQQRVDATGGAISGGTGESVSSGTTRNKRSVWNVGTYPFPDAHFATFPPEIPKTCIKAGCPEGGTVLDPFNGAGTTGLVAVQLGRNYVGIELNPEYIEMSKRRIEPEVEAIGIRESQHTFNFTVEGR